MNYQALLFALVGTMFGTLVGLLINIHADRQEAIGVHRPVFHTVLSVVGLAIPLTAFITILTLAS